MERSFEWGERIPFGLFYKDNQPTYEDSEPALRKAPLVKHPLGITKELFDSLVQEMV